MKNNIFTYIYLLLIFINYFSGILLFFKILHKKPSLVHFQSRLFYHFFLCRLSPSLRDCVTLYVCTVLVCVCVCLSLFAFEFSLHRVRCISCLALFCTLNLSISRLSRSVCHSTFVSRLFDPTFDSALSFSFAFQKFSQERSCFLSQDHVFVAVPSRVRGSVCSADRPCGNGR